MLAELPVVEHPDLLVGRGTADDAGVFRVREDLALIQTVDFFTPIVDDPRTFGRIAAANALSDVYAMGGTPLTAMNIVCFPRKSLPLEVLRDVLLGGLEMIQQAGALLVGGHSVEDPELKYGLSVTGTVHPDRVVTNAGAQPGDRLILTKPLGTGVLATAIKGGHGATRGRGRGGALDDHPQPGCGRGHAGGRGQRLHRHHRLRPARPRAGDGQGLAA